MEEYTDDRSKQLRQKAISLLYLLFIALVFIYVPSDFLDSITETKRTFETTSAKLNALKEKKFYMFEQPGMTISRNQVIDSNSYYRISRVSDSTVDYIEEMKTMLLSETGGNNAYGYPAKSKEFDVTDRLMLNTDRATNLKAMLVAYRYEMRKVMSKPHQQNILDSIMLIKNEIISSKGKPIEWEKFHFKKSPLSVTLMMLSKFQSEIRLIEYLILDKYERDFLESYFVRSGIEQPLDDVLSDSFQIFTSKDIVAPGEKIMLFPSSSEPLKDVLKNMRVQAKTRDGVEMVNVSPEGKIEYTPKKPGDVVFTAQYGNAKSTISIKVIPRKTNVRTKDYEILYAGIKNPLKINFSDYNQEDLNVEVNKGNITRYDSLYYVISQQTGLLELSISTVVEGEKVVLKTKRFNVKPLPLPYATLSGKNGGTLSSRAAQIQTRLNVNSDVFNDGQYYRIMGFSLMRMPTTGVVAINEIKNQGATFNTAVKREMELAQKGDLYIFSNIKAIGRDNIEKQVPSLVFKIE